MSEDEASSGSASPPAGDGAMRPTVVKAPVRRAHAPGGGAGPVAPAAPERANANEPTTIRGVRKVRIEVSAQHLRTLSPGSDASTCEAAARMLAEVAVGPMNERKAVLWGHDLQKSYGDMMGRTLALVQDPLAEQARAHVDRMTQLLASIDVMAACGHGKRGLIARFAGPINNRVDTPAELAAAMAELGALLDRLGSATAGLAELAERLHQHAAAMGRLEREVDAAAIAALHLAQHHEREFPELARRFTDRAMSLVATVAQMREGDALHRLQLRQPLDVIGVIQDVALVALPGFLTGLAALLALAKTRSATPTDARDMSYQLRNLLNQFTERKT